jgi:hypothetical protein
MESPRTIQGRDVVSSKLLDGGLAELLIVLVAGCEAHKEIQGLSARLAGCCASCMKMEWPNQATKKAFVWGSGVTNFAFDGGVGALPRSIIVYCTVGF